MSAVKRTGCCKCQLHMGLGSHCGDCHLKCVAVCCNVLQCDAMCCNVLQCVAVCCNVWPGDWHLKCVQKGAVYCSVLQTVQPVPIHSTWRHRVHTATQGLWGQTPYSYTRTVGTDPTQLHKDCGDRPHAAAQGVGTVYIDWCCFYYL